MLIPGAVHGGDEVTDLQEAPSATENGGTQASYGISQHRTMVEGERERDGSGSVPPEKLPTLSRMSEHALLEHGVKVAITIDICSPEKKLIL